MHQPDDSTPIGDTLEVLGELVHEARSESSVRANIDASTLRLSDEELAALEEP